MGWGAIAAAAAPYVTGALSYLGQRSANAATAASSAKQMRFQNYMSSTAHQREVNDLIKAGLNPILSAKYGGASTPGGASYQAQNEVTPAVNSAVALAANRAQVELLKAQVDKTRAETVNVQAETPYIPQQRHWTIEKTIAEAQRTLQEKILTGNKVNESQLQQTAQKIGNRKARAELLAVQNKWMLHAWFNKWMSGLSDDIEAGATNNSAKSLLEKIK